MRPRGRARPWSARGLRGRSARRPRPHRPTPQGTRLPERPRRDRRERAQQGTWHAARARRPAPARRRAASCRRWRLFSSSRSNRLARLRGRRLLRDLTTREPRHHFAQLAADLLDRVLLLERAPLVQRRRALAVLGDPLLRVRAVLDVAQDVLHLLTDARVDDPRAHGEAAVPRGARQGVALVAEPAFVEEVAEDLHLVPALEVRALGLVPRLDERLERRLHELADAAAEDDLLAEPVRFDFLGERRLDDAGARRADALRVCERGLLGLAGGILVHGDERGDTLAFLEDLTHPVPRGLRRDHHDVGLSIRLDLAEVD